MRKQAAEAYARRAMPNAGKDDPLPAQLAVSAHKGINIFAGENGDQGGFIAVARFLDQLPEADRENAARIYMKLLNGTLWELWQMARARDGLEPAAADEKHARFLQLATNALADSVFYGAPVYLKLEEFTEVKASVLQITRSPGKTIVYIGCLLLTLGVFAMFYIRERRIWVWLRDGAQGSHALMAMSTQRKTLDFEQEFNDIKAKLPQSA
jgi:cytochrome c biogenesis protein